MSSRTKTLDLIENHLKTRNSATITLSEIVDVLSERAFGLTLLFLALPNAIGLTIIPGISTLFGIPVILISLQMILGRTNLFLPKKLGSYQLSRQDCLNFITQSRPYVEKLETFTKPRLLWFSQNIGLNLTGIMVLILGLIIALPLLFGNLLGGISLLILALGLSQDDGLFILIGSTLAILISITYISIGRYLIGEAYDLFLRFI